MNPPSFQFNADAFLAGTADLTQQEVGAYILLLCHQWGKGEIPTEPARASLIAKGEVSEHVLAKFPNGKNPRLERERAVSEAAKVKSTLPSSSPSPSSSSPFLPTPLLPPSPISSSPTSSHPPKHLKIACARAKPTTADFIEHLKTNPAYQHINIDIELGKMDAWLLTKPGRQKTRQFVLNWLNKLPPPLPFIQPQSKGGLAPGTKIVS